MSEPEVVPEPVKDPEPEGAVDVQGKRMVPVEALIAEREKAKTSTEKKIREEYEPLRAQAEQARQLQADLEALRPHIDYLQKHPEMIERPPQDDGPKVSNEDAERFARQYELYTPTGLDTNRAKQIIANQRDEMAKVARAAAAEAVGPVLQQSAHTVSRQNFVWAAQQQGPDGSPLVDPQVLAAVWQEFPVELSANPEVARVILEASIGRSLRTGKMPRRSENEPLFSESPGGRGGGGFRPSEREIRVAQAAGMTKEQYTKAASAYRPDSINVLED